MAKRDDRTGEDRLIHPANEGHDEERARMQRRAWAEQQDPRLPEQRHHPLPSAHGTHDTSKPHETSRPAFEPHRERPSGEGKWSTGGEPKRAGKADENSGGHRPVGASPPPDDQAFHRHAHGTKPAETTGGAQRRRHPPEE